MRRERAKRVSDPVSFSPKNAKKKRIGLIGLIGLMGGGNWGFCGIKKAEIVDCKWWVRII
jgi:hypothetical protein